MPMFMTRGKKRCAVVLALCALCLLGGCARLSVSHLDARPWKAGASGEVTMKFWRFEFTSVLAGEAYGVRGRAVPLTGGLPPWADRLEELTLTAYLRDASGNVLASASKTYKNIPLTPDTAMPFEFKLTPTAESPAGYAVSFGYKAMYVSSKARAALSKDNRLPEAAVFFAGEGALLKQ